MAAHNTFTGRVIMNGHELLAMAAAIQEGLKGKDLAQIGCIVDTINGPGEHEMTTRVYELEGRDGKPAVIAEHTFPITYYHGPDIPA